MGFFTFPIQSIDFMRSAQLVSPWRKWPTCTVSLWALRTWEGHQLMTLTCSCVRSGSFLSGCFTHRCCGRFYVFSSARSVPYSSFSLPHFRTRKEIVLIAYFAYDVCGSTYKHNVNKVKNTNFIWASLLHWYQTPRVGLRIRAHLDHLRQESSPARSKTPIHTLDEPNVRERGQNMANLFYLAQAYNQAQALIKITAVVD